MINRRKFLKLAGVSSLAGTPAKSILESLDTQDMGSVHLIESNFRFDIVGEVENFRNQFYVSASDYLLDNAVLDGELVFLPHASKSKIEKFKSDRIIRH